MQPLCARRRRGRNCHPGVLALALPASRRHNAAVNLLPQDVPTAASPSPELMQQLQTLSWVDHTALGVLLVFFVLGLFKGLIWQVSRIAILVVAYVVAGRFGGEVAGMLAATTGAPSSEAPGSEAPGSEAPGETTIYLAYVLLFLAVLIVLSLLAMLLQKLAVKAGLGFFDRVGGGVLGVATGACVVLFALSVVNMFFRGSQLALAADGSHSLRLCKRAIESLGSKVPDDLRAVFALTPLDAVPLPAGEGTPPSVPPPSVTPPPVLPGTRPPVEIQGGGAPGKR